MASNWAPVLMLLGSIIGVLGIVALVIFVALPKLMPLIGISYNAPFAPTPTPSPTPKPTPTPNPMDSFVALDEQKEVVFDGSSAYTWFGDPYFYDDKLILTAGKLVDGNAVLGEAYLYEPETRTAEKLSITPANAHILFPKFNDDFIVYLDAKLDGGGALMGVKRSGGTPFLIKDIYTGQVEPMLYEHYVAWIERTGTRMDKLFLLDLDTMENVTLHLFSNNSNGQSLPSLRDGYLTWSAEGTSGSGSGDTSVIYTIKLGSSSIDQYTPGTYVHDPLYNGKYTVWLDAHHAENTRLYYSEGKSDAMMIDSGVVQCGLGDDFVAYAKDEVIYAYRFDNKKTYRLSAEYEQAMFLGVSDNYVIWMDVTSRERDILKFSKLP